MTNCLLELDLRGVYTSDANDLVADFLNPALRRAQIYERAAGYFRTSAFERAADGLAPFLNNGGHVKLLFGAEMTSADLAGAAGHGVTDELIGEVRDGLLTATGVRRDAAALLGALLAAGRLTVKVAVGPQVRFHAKYGRFEDACGHSVAFHGSANETASGWSGNLEQITTHRGWNDAEAGHHDKLAAAMGRWWRGNAGPGLTVVDLPAAIADALIAIADTTPPNRRTPAVSGDPDMDDLVRLLRASQLAHGEAAGLAHARRLPLFEQRRLALRLSVQHLTDEAHALRTRTA